jgi:hypothetical protein
MRGDHGSRRGQRDSREEHATSERGNVAADVGNDADEQALADHHLDEVAEMIEQAQADRQSSSDTLFSDGSARELRGQ